MHMRVVWAAPLRAKGLRGGGRRALGREHKGLGMSFFVLGKFGYARILGGNWWNRMTRFGVLTTGGSWAEFILSFFVSGVSHVETISLSF